MVVVDGVMLGCSHRPPRPSMRGPAVSRPAQLEAPRPMQEPSSTTDTEHIPSSRKQEAPGRGVLRRTNRGPGDDFHRQLAIHRHPVGHRPGLGRRQYLPAVPLRPVPVHPPQPRLFDPGRLRGPAHPPRRQPGVDPGPDNPRARGRGSGLRGGPERAAASGATSRSSNTWIASNTRSSNWRRGSSRASRSAPADRGAASLLARPRSAAVVRRPASARREE